MRSSKISLAFMMKYKRNTGVYDEDHVNDFNARSYTSARTMMEWYARMENIATRTEVRKRVSDQSDHNQNGRHFTGAGPFERELERKGITVEKYPLTTTTGATRVREMVVLRRQVLEKKSAEAMNAARTTLRRAAPSEWYDETRGPLNPKFLKAMQPHYDVAITELPRRPLEYSNWIAQTQIGSERKVD
jgi:hypothetical protein